ncbi:MAG: phosphoenolpyruvate--protein phosphotransferase [Treponema sp.]|jgi:phosphotransferase system enzyme I (PtsI)|nr:phosphoenolpyruvate--protein phosphotransferase [Treponema sp.]
MKTFTGIPVSTGVAYAKALVYMVDETIPRHAISEEEAPAELKRLKNAIAEAAAEAQSLLERAGREMSREQADIFQAHLFMLEDVCFHEQINNRLKESLCNAEWVVWEVSQELSQKLMQSPDANLRERAIDISDVSRRIIGCLISDARGHSPLADLDEEVILVSQNLMPSDMVNLNKNCVKGIVMDEGSGTCHTAILARAFNIPAVMGISGFSRIANDGEPLALNGMTGLVVTNPDKQLLARFKTEEKHQRKQTDRLNALRELPAETIDGWRVALKANISLPEEAETLKHYGAEGIGLYRSEFLYITPGKAPDEETQYKAYSQVLKAMGGLPVTIRTMDMGGDKIVPELHAAAQIDNEKNPLLGWRAIRLSLANPEMFKVQLRAILRASAHGNTRIMFPMISGIEELEQAHAMLDEARAECKKLKQPFSKDIEVGAMIEIPSAAMTADILAEKADFFSIGTNDLIQYSLAVDRGNEKVCYLGEAFHPAILRFLKRTIDAAHERGIKAAMCGELAGDPEAACLLLGLGLDEFSMAASSIPRIKEIIRSSSLKACKSLAADALRARSIEEVRSLLNEWKAGNARKH